MSSLHVGAKQPSCHSVASMLDMDNSEVCYKTDFRRRKSFRLRTLASADASSVISVNYGKQGCKFLAASCLLSVTFAATQLTIAINYIRDGEQETLLANHVIMPIMLFIFAGEIAYITAFPKKRMSFPEILIWTTAGMIFLMGICSLLLTFRSLPLDITQASEQQTSRVEWISLAVKPAQFNKPAVIPILIVFNLIFLGFDILNSVAFFKLYKPIKEDAEAREDQSECDSTTSE
ncbi:hypothetical protein T265_07998 [Opisthorchis viverrini]|uniref:Uncharacterized protein n=1 Tax=Opisthorchis viverrini TaxID=6198 RepID=A0A074ZFA1_OPIVI|nr:hypothetical protein T265_07998 [Opisthorchis viverrini]KER24312.1 hypothetical protein T265_07998 [Opisthorchis viverrini]